MNLVEQSLDSQTKVGSQPVDLMAALAQTLERTADDSKSSAPKHTKWHGWIESMLLLPSHRCESFTEHAGSRTGILPG